MSEERPLTDLERELLLKLLENDFEGRNALREQIGNCVAIPTGDPDNYGSIYLKTLSNAKSETTLGVPVEGELLDGDSPVLVILHVKNGFIDELEILRADGNPLQDTLDPTDMEVTIRKN